LVNKYVKEYKMPLRKIVIVFFLFFSAITLFSQTAESPKIMYVTVAGGLRQRQNPSANSKIVGTFLYCEPIRISGKSENTITIDGITDYWYKTDCDIYFEGAYIKYSWVFGGYISEKLPSGVPVTKIEGYWVGDLNNEGISYIFSGNTFIFSGGHGEYQCKGTFSFTGDTIIFHRLYEIIWHSEEGWQKIDSTDIHTYTLSSTILKISKNPTSSKDYNISRVYTLEFLMEKYKE
jgi:hypothetical protein